MTTHVHKNNPKETKSSPATDVPDPWPVPVWHPSDCVFESKRVTKTRGKKARRGLPPRGRQEEQPACARGRRRTGHDDPQVHQRLGSATADSVVAET